MDKARSRAGRYVTQLKGYRAFVPRPLPPDPPIDIDAELSDLLFRAALALGRLDGATDVLPDPDLFVYMFMREEAVLSSQIEGTQTSLLDLLDYERVGERAKTPDDVQDVANYVRAMSYGLERLDTLPLSLRLIREIHAELMKGVRGEHLSPGRFRRSQNWIGRPGSDLSSASFVPPSPGDMLEALAALERYFHTDSSLPALIRVGLVHVQFETIHPFLDGNGRIGRLLITLQLCEMGILQRPLLYLSFYLKRYRGGYYAALQAVRDSGDWEGWLTYFLQGVEEVARIASQRARAIIAMREEHRLLIREHLGSTMANALRLLERLYRQPLTDTAQTWQHLDVSYQTANRLLVRLEKLGILEEITGQRRNRVYSYAPYLALFTDLEGDLSQ